MKKTELTAAVDACKAAAKAALQTVYDALNQGQQQKILKDEAVAQYFELYEVEV